MSPCPGFSPLLKCPVAILFFLIDLLHIFGCLSVLLLPFFPFIPFASSGLFSPKWCFSVAFVCHLERHFYWQVSFLKLLLLLRPVRLLTFLALFWTCIPPSLFHSSSWIFSASVVFCSIFRQRTFGYSLNKIMNLQDRI